MKQPKEHHTRSAIHLQAQHSKNLGFSVCLNPAQRAGTPGRGNIFRFFQNTASSTTNFFLPIFDSFLVVKILQEQRKVSHLKRWMTSPFEAPTGPHLEDLHSLCKALATG